MVSGEYDSREGGTKIIIPGILRHFCSEFDEICSAWRIFCLMVLS